MARNNGLTLTNEEMGFSDEEMPSKGLTLSDEEMGSASDGAVLTEEEMGAGTSIFREELRALPETRDAFKVEIPEEEITKKRYELFTDSMLKDVYGEQGLKDIKTGQRRTEIFMSRAPKIAMAFASPLTAIAFETYDQAKTALVSAVKKEKYNPFELRMLSELLPKGTPSALKTAASVGETLSDIAIIGGAMNMATEGTLRGVLKEVGTKLEKAGYGKGRITISREAIKNAAKGTRLEDAAKQYLKAKNLKVSPLMEQIAQKGVVTPVPGAKAPLIAPTTPKTPIVGGVSKGLVPVKPIEPTKAPEVAPEAPIAKPVISTPQARKEAISKPLGEGVERVPKLIQRIENKHIAELESKGITYNRLDIQKDAALAVDFVGKFPSRAKNISYNRETPPQGITGSSIREAYRHSVENNPVEYRKVIQAEALREVRLGQEIATLKEWRTASDPMNYIKDVMAQRLQKIAPLDITYKTTQAKAKTQQAGELVIRQKVDTIKQSFTKDIKLQNAQEILKRIIC